LIYIHLWTVDTLQMKYFTRVDIFHVDLHASMEK